MHIPDTFIPLGQAAIYWIISILFIARAVKWARRDMNENMIPLFGDGGITVMGANILNMGIIGGFMGYYTFIGLSKLSVKRHLAMFAGAWLSMLLPAIALSFELWLAGTFPLKQGVLLMGTFQGIAGIGEGLITVIVFGALIRANGAGKSTVFKHFNGRLNPTSGEIRIKGRPISSENIMDVRKTVGVVFQDPDDQIFAPTVNQDVAFGPMNLGLGMEEIDKRVRESLETVRLTGFEERAPHHLSTGEKKKVAIAGILAMQPEVLVLDEPTAGLDPGGAMRLIKLINGMNRYLGITTIVSTHEVDIVPMLADRVCIISKGKIIGDGTPLEIFSSPELIKKTHLRLPMVAQLMEMLQEEGVGVEVKFTLDEARDELLKVVK